MVQARGTGHCNYLWISTTCSALVRFCGCKEGSNMFGEAGCGLIKQDMMKQRLVLVVIMWTPEPSQISNTTWNLVFSQSTRRKFIPGGPTAAAAGRRRNRTVCFLFPSSSCCPNRTALFVFTFVLQRVAGSNPHGSADGLSRAVNHLVVGESDVKFLQLPHDSLHSNCVWSSSRCSAGSPAAAAKPRPTTRVTSPRRVTPHTNFFYSPHKLCAHKSKRSASLTINLTYFCKAFFFL